MSKFWSLTKVLFKTDLFPSSSASNKSKKKKNSTFLLFGLLIAFVAVTLCVPIIMGLCNILSVMPIEKIIISLVLPLAGVTTIVFSIFSVVSVFYLSKNSDYLLPMPFKPRDILLSKFIVSLMTDYYILFVFILPILLGVGIGTGAGFLYYVYMILTFILLPVIPSAIVTLIILFLTRFIGVFKNKDVFMYVSMLLVLVFSFGYSYLIQNVIDVDPSYLGSTFSELENNLLPYFKWIFPFYNSASSALINYNGINGFFSFIAFLAFNFIAVLIVYLCGDKLYLKSLTSNSNIKNKKANVEDVTYKSNKKMSPTSMLLKKEWLVVKRTPVFMLNIVASVLIVPVVFIFSALAGFVSGGESVDTAGMIDVSKYLSDPMVYFIVLLVCLFFTSSSLAASTSISREGSSAWFMKIIPVSYFKQINVKVLFAVIIDVLGVLLIGVVPVLCFKIPISYVLCVFVPIAILDCIINYLNILLDLNRPKIKWSDESAAVKQNFNGLLSIVITIGFCAFLGVIAFIVNKINLSINIWILSLIVSVIFGIVLFVIVYLFKKNEHKLLNNVD